MSQMFRTFLFLIAVSGPALAQPTGEESRRLLGQSEQTYKRLVEVDRDLTAGKAIPAADELQQLIKDAENDLVSSDGKHYQPAWRIVQRLLVRLPAPLLQSYRDRTDPPARLLLQQGRDKRDPQPLRELIKRYFPCRPAEEALLLLGELCFERGDFREAELHWRRLLPGKNSFDEDPSFPDPQMPLAPVQARAILATIFQQDLARAREELQDFREKYPRESGRLAGKDGPLAETLQSLIDKPPRRPKFRDGGTWTGFAGNRSRTGQVNGILPRYLPSQPTWHAEIPRDDPRFRPPLPRTGTGRSAAFHPVMLTGTIYFSDTLRVYAINPRDGQLRVVYDLRTANELSRFLPLGIAVPPPQDSDFTLTVADGQLIARLGPPIFPRHLSGEPDALPSFLVALKPDPFRPTKQPLQPSWILAPPRKPGATTSWEAAPVVKDGRLYAAYRHAEGTLVTYGIACYASPPGERPLWTTEVATGPAPSLDSPRLRHEPLTLAGESIVFCTHDGTVAALDLGTGKPSWAIRYPRPTRPPQNPLRARDLCPPLASDGRVFVAPNDSDMLLALDAVSGRILWQAEGVEIEQILGVSQGRLVCAIAGPQRGIRGFDIRTGSTRPPEGWMQHDDPLLKSFGRGLVSEDVILWPSAWGLFFLNPQDGLPIRQPLPGVHGNLALAEGILLIGTATGVAAFVPDELRDPVRPTILGLSEQRHQLHQFAQTKSWNKLESWLKSSELPEANRLLARFEQERAEYRLNEHDRDAAKMHFHQGANTQVPLAWRVRAVARLLNFEPAGGGEAAWQNFQERHDLDAESREAWVLTTDGQPIRLNELACQHFTAARTPPRRLPAEEVHEPTRGFDVTTLVNLNIDVAVASETHFPRTCWPLGMTTSSETLPGLERKASRPLLLVSDGKQVIAYPPSATSPGWRSPLPAGLMVNKAITTEHEILALGPDGVVSIDRNDGSRRWWFQLPTAAPLPRSDGDQLSPWADYSHIPALQDFTKVGRRLLARLGQQQLLALNLDDGSVAWIRDGTGRTGFQRHTIPTAPGFSHLYSTQTNNVVVRTTAGERWLINALTGDVRSRMPTSAVEWESSPAIIPDGRIILADGPASITALDPNWRQVSWGIELGGEASLAGRAAQVLDIPAGLIVAIFRNHGVELTRLSWAGGSPTWSNGPTLLPVGNLDLTTAATDGMNLYVIADDRVHAIRLADGKRIWTHALPPDLGPCSLAAGTRGLFLFPRQPQTEEPFSTILGRVVRSFMRFPAVGSLPRIAVSLYDSWVTRTASLLVLDSETGELRNRLSLPAVGPILQVGLATDHPVIVTARRAYWLK